MSMDRRKRIQIILQPSKEESDNYGSDYVAAMPDLKSCSLLILRGLRAQYLLHSLPRTQCRAVLQWPDLAGHLADFVLLYKINQTAQSIKLLFVHLLTVFFFAQDLSINE